MSFYQMHRGWLDSDMFADAAYDERSAWAWIIGEARFADGFTSINGKPQPTKRGQFYSSIRFMAEKFGWSKDRVTRFLKRLEAWGALSVETATGQNLITVCNYSQYQSTKDTPKDRRKDTNKDGVKDTPKDKLEEIQEGQEGQEKNKGKISKPEDVSETVWEDFKTLRKAKNAAITGTAINGIRREAEKAGIDLESAMREMCTRGWQGFKAEWLTKKGNENASTIGNNTNGNPRAGNKSERAKAAMLKSGIELGYIHPPEGRRDSQEATIHAPAAVL